MGGLFQVSSPNVAFSAGFVTANHSNEIDAMFDAQISQIVTEIDKMLDIIQRMRPEQNVVGTPSLCPNLLLLRSVGADGVHSQALPSQEDLALPHMFNPNSRLSTALGACKSWLTTIQWNRTS